METIEQIAERKRQLSSGIEQPKNVMGNDVFTIVEITYYPPVRTGGKPIEYRHYYEPEVF